MKRIAQSFGLELIATAEVREQTQRNVADGAKVLQNELNEKAMQIHLQRIVGAYVGSACGAGQFYSKAVSDARQATAKLSNDARDEDLDGPAGFDSRAQRKREFAAVMGLQAHALLAAAEGAVAAYAHRHSDVMTLACPPIAMPDELIASASARRRRNHPTIAFASGCPLRLEPTATTKNAPKNVTGDRIWESSTNPVPKISIPARMTARGPKRSVSQPWIGPSSPLSTRAIENAAENIVLLQPNSSRSSTT